MAEQMRLTAVIKDWLNSRAWEDEVHVDHLEQTAKVKTGIKDQNHSFRVYIESDEK